jgi:hypothetical protein
MIRLTQHEPSPRIHPDYQSSSDCGRLVVLGNPLPRGGVRRDAEGSPSHPSALGASPTTATSYSLRQLMRQARATKPGVAPAQAQKDVPRDTAYHPRPRVHPATPAARNKCERALSCQLLISPSICLGDI